MILLRVQFRQVKQLIFGCTLLFFAAFSRTTHAFPEMVRHGYVNCTTCHVSPTGGGTLTAYGRGLSKEVLSTWAREGEEKAAYRVVRTPEWLLLGGDYRQIYLYRDTSTVREGMPIFMQGDLEFAAQASEKTWIDLSLGYQELRSSERLTDHLISRVHSLNYRPTDELSLRVGRFFYAYGIQLPDHAVLVRGGLPGARNGLSIHDQGTETYNLETAWMGERFSIFVTGILGRPDAPELDREKGIAVMPSLAVGDTYKTGLSYLYAANSRQSRHVAGPYAILGFSPRWTLLSELDFQFLQGNEATATQAQSGTATLLRLDYEAMQGLHFNFTQQWGRSQISDSSSQSEAYALGIQFFPRPHFEIALNWQKQATQATSPDFIDVAWLLLHFYL